MPANKTQQVLSKTLLGAGNVFTFQKTLGDAAFTLDGQVNGAVRSSVFVDRGDEDVAKPVDYDVLIVVKPLSAGAILRSRIEYYMIFPDQTGLIIPGNLTNADATRAADDVGSLVPIGPVWVNAVGGATLIQKFQVKIWSRFVGVANRNLCGATLDTGTNIHSVTFTPHVPDIQAAA